MLAKKPPKHSGSREGKERKNGNGNGKGNGKGKGRKGGKGEEGRGEGRGKRKDSSYGRNLCFPFVAQGENVPHKELMGLI